MFTIDELMQHLQTGKTYKAIGLLYGISKQRVHQQAKKLGIVRVSGRRNTKVAANPAEIYVAKQLTDMGLRVDVMPYNSLYDLLVNKSIRVEVKHRKRASTKAGVNNRFYYQIHQLAPRDHDILIIVTGELDKQPACYVLPTGHRTITIPVTPLYYTAMQQYRDNWDLFYKALPITW